jgi:hypothetical protein
MNSTTKRGLDMETFFGLIVFFMLLPIAIAIGEILLTLAFLVFCLVTTFVVELFPNKEARP